MKNLKRLNLTDTNLNRSVLDIFKNMKDLEIIKDVTNEIKLQIKNGKCTEMELEKFKNPDDSLLEPIND